MGVFEKVQDELMSWPGVTSGSHRFGGTEFRVNNREMGHMHGSSWADLPFPMSIRHELVSAGKVQPRHVLPKSGWVTFYIEKVQDADVLISLFKMQYDRLAKKAN